MFIGLAPIIRMLRLGRYTHPCAASFPTSPSKFSRLQPAKYINPLPLSFSTHLPAQIRPSFRPVFYVFVLAFLFVIP